MVRSVFVAHHTRLKVESEKKCMTRVSPETVSQQLK